MNPGEDYVVFPSHISSANLPDELVSFFAKNGISLSSDSFPLDALRRLYRTDNEAFRRIKYQLEVFGFNFHSIKGADYFAPEIKTPCTIVTSAPDGGFYPMELTSLGLLDFVDNIGSSKRTSLVGVVIERMPVKSQKVLLKYLELQGYGLETVALFEGIALSEPDPQETVKVSDGLPHSIPAEGKPIELAIDNAVKGFCIPYFCLRFFSEIIASGTEIQNSYIDSGIRTFGELIRVSATDISRLVSAFSKATDDSYLSGIAEENLVTFCRAKEAFLSTHQQNDLETFFDLKRCDGASDPDIFALALPINDPARYRFGSPQFDLTCINQQTIAYLQLFAINDLSILTSSVLSFAINRFFLSEDYQWCRLLFSPFAIFEEIAADFEIKHTENPFAFDKEISLVSINRKISSYKKKLESLKGRFVEITSLRETGMTLEEVARREGVTRERIRQMQAKCVRNIAYEGAKAIHSLLQYKEFIPLEVLQSLPGLISLVNDKSMESIYYVDEDLNVITSQRNKGVLQAKKEEYLRHSGRINCDEISFEYSESGLCLYGWLNGESDHLEYDPYPVYIPKLASLYQIGADYLKSKGQKGYDINKDKEDAMAYFERHAPGSTAIGYRAITNDILRSGSTLRGMSRYMSDELVKPEQIKVVSLILNGIKFSPYGITGQAIFSQHGDLLKLNGVDDPYFVYGIASTFLKKSFNFNGRGLRIFKGPVLSLDEMAEAYINENGNPFVKEAAFREALSLGPTALEQCKVVTKFDKSTLLLKSWFQVRRQDFEYMEEIIDRMIKLHGYCHCQEILMSELFFEQEKNYFLHTNRLTSPTRVAYYFDVMCERLGVTKYHVSHHCDCISLASNPVETKADLLQKHFAGKAFTKKEAEELLKSYKLTANISSNEFFKGWALFIDKDRLILKSDLSISKEMLRTASDILSQHFSEDIFITARQAVAWLKVMKIDPMVTKSEIGLASAMTSEESCRWASPQNDMTIATSHPIELLANKEFFDEAIPPLSKVIKRFIFSSFPGKFVTYDEVVKALKESELLDIQLAYSYFQQIFDGYLTGQILEVPQ